MKVIRSMADLRQNLKSPVATIGIFDGVHLGHQRIIRAAVRQAKRLKGASIVISFSPHPLKVLSVKKRSPRLIMSLERRISLIRQLGAEVLLLLGFNKKLSRMSAEDFIKCILVDIIGIRYLIAAKNFRFGTARSGTISLLEKLSRKFGFKLLKIKPVKVNGKIISSTNIRRLIQEGKIRQANALLGRTFSIMGKVGRGDRRGRILGYPTANIVGGQELVPCGGVYAVFAKLDKKVFPGVLNIGLRPTFKIKRDSPPTIEVHLFDFHQQIYARDMEVLFIQRIRREKRFASQKKLLTQIRKDELLARKILPAQVPLPNPFRS